MKKVKKKNGKRTIQKKKRHFFETPYPHLILMIVFLVMSIESIDVGNLTLGIIALLIVILSLIIYVLRRIKE
jgi:hypothetical protein